MAHKFNPKQLEKLDNAWRRANMPPVETLKTLGLSSQDTLVDIGSGIGYFTIPAVKEIGVVKAYALDTSEAMLDELMIRAQAVLGDSNSIARVITEEYDLKIVPDTATFVLMVNVLHEIDDKDLFLEAVHKAIQTGGKLAIIEWMKTETESGPPLGHRISAEEAQKLLEVAGFQIDTHHTFAEMFYGLVAVKR